MRRAATATGHEMRWIPRMRQVKGDQLAPEVMKLGSQTGTETPGGRFLSFMSSIVARCWSCSDAEK